MSSFEAVELFVNGQAVHLDDGNPFWFLGEEGFGAAQVERLSQRGPQQHGDSDVGFRLEPRLCSIVLGIEGESEADFWTARQTLIAHFAPYHKPQLRFMLRNGDVRQLDVYHVSDLDMPSLDRLLVVQRVLVGLKAPDPTFYDPGGVSVTFALGGGSDSFAVPMSVPHSVGASTINETRTIAYDGSWFGFPHLIRITGPITDPVITNETTGEKLDFTGITIATDDYYDIDTRFGRKAVVDSNGNNRIADLTSDSDLATWHLAPDSAEASNGINSIRVTGSNVTEATKVEVNWLNRYLGI